MSERHNRLLGLLTIFTLALVLFYLPSIIFYFDKGGGHAAKHRMDLIVSTFYTASFMLNYFWLVPSMLMRTSRLPLYLLINLVMVVGVMVFIPLYVQIEGGWDVPPDKDDLSLLRNALVYAGFSIRDGIMMVLAAALGYALRLGKEKEALKTRELELNAERRHIELRNLKAQLNPHFLFNSLNNIYALIGIAPERAQKALHDLSSVLRFVIYDGASATVSLDKVNRFIDEYVDMMRLRQNEGCRIEYDVEPDIPGGIMIEPLLYATLVENAFKHSSRNERDHYICIKLQVSRGYERFEKGHDRALVFEVVNSVSGKSSPGIEAERSGVGLVNIGRQLKLLYPGRHSFSISEEEGEYRAEVRIGLRALRRDGK